MTARYLLDTNIVSEPIRPAPDRRIIAWLLDHRYDVAIASVVWHELWFGCYHLPPSRRRRSLEIYLNEMVLTAVPILPYDQKAAHWHAEERARLAGLGRMPPLADSQIAAVAYTNGLVLVTRNVRDFAGFEGLEVESWADE